MTYIHTHTHTYIHTDRQTEEFTTLVKTLYVHAELRYTYFGP